MSLTLIVVGVLLFYFVGCRRIPGSPLELAKFPLCSDAAGFEMDKMKGFYRPAITYSEELGSCRLEDFQVLYMIGKGSFGEVHAAIHTPTGKKVALKEISAANPKRKAKIRAEECYHHIMKHPNISRHYCTMVEQDAVVFALELVKGKELRPLLRSRSAARLTESQKHQILRQSIDVTEYMHSKGIVYGDLKSANIILTDTPQMDIKIVDFGLSRWNPKGNVEKKFEHSFAVDWFLVGALYFELATDGKIFREYCIHPSGWRRLQHTIKCPQPATEEDCEIIKKFVLKDSKLYNDLHF